MRGGREKEKQNRIKMKVKGVEDELSQMLLAPYEGEMPQMLLAQEEISQMSLRPCSPDRGEEKEHKMKGKREEVEARMEIRKMSLGEARNHPPVSNVAFKTSDDASHVSVNVSDLERSLVNRLEQNLLLEPKQLRRSSGSPSCCIHEVPQYLRQGHKDYNPQIISIGPFHRGKKSLQAMEEHKLKYLQAFVSWTGSNSLMGHVMTVKMLEKRARECYSKNFTNLKSSEFVEMMVLDGCFIIVLLCKAANVIFSTSESDPDPIFKLPWLMKRVQIDLLRFENQIPYFVLQHLFDRMKISESLADLVVEFFSGIVSTRETKEESNPDLEIRHLLHLLHSNLVPKTKGEFNEDLKMILSVTNLRDAGIEFKKGKEDSCFLEIEYEEGVIKIPPVTIVDSTIPLWRNFIAFEQCYIHCESQITTYITFMNCLISSPKDVDVLSHKDIIDNWLGSDEEVANLVNELGKDVLVGQKFYLADVFRRVNEYCEVPSHKWRATLMQKYFGNPWAIISLIAATILLLIAIIQLIFSAISL